MGSDEKTRLQAHVPPGRPGAGQAVWRRDKRRGELHFLELVVWLSRQNPRACNRRTFHSHRLRCIKENSMKMGKYHWEVVVCFWPLSTCFSSSSNGTSSVKPSLTPPGIDLLLPSHRTVSVYMPILPGTQRAPRGRYSIFSFGSHSTWDGV